MARSHVNSSNFCASHAARSSTLETCMNRTERLKHQHLNEDNDANRSTVTPRIWIGLIQRKYANM